MERLDLDDLVKRPTDVIAESTCMSDTHSITTGVGLIDGAVSRDLLRNAATSSDLLVALETGLRIANVLLKPEQLVSYQDRSA